MKNHCIVTELTMATEGSIINYRDGRVVQKDGGLLIFVQRNVGGGPDDESSTSKSKFTIAIKVMQY